MIIFIIYIAVVAAMSLITLFAYYSDKKRAIRGEWRIRESVLFALGFFGGALGALLGMNIFRHKTKHWYFWFNNIIFLLLHIIAGVLLFYLGIILGLADALQNI